MATSRIGLDSYQHLRDLQAKPQQDLDAFNESEMKRLDVAQTQLENTPISDTFSHEDKRKAILGIRQQKFKLMTPKLAKKRLAELQQKYGLTDNGPQTGTVPAEQPLNVGGMTLPGKGEQQISRPADINDILASGQPTTQGQWISDEYNQLMKLGYDPAHAKKLIDFRMGYRDPNERGNWEIISGTLNGKRVSLQHNKFDGSYTDPNGNAIDATGFVPDPKASMNPRLGTFGEFLQRVAEANGITTDDLSPDTVLQLRQAFAAAGTPVRITQGSYQYKDEMTGNIYTVPINRKSFAAPVPMPQITPKAPTSAPTAAPVAGGALTPGNIDLHNRPIVPNGQGYSTVRSKSFNFDRKEVLLPTVSDDGRLLSDSEAIDQYRKTGKHLGIFKTPEDANRYAQQLHLDQEKEYGGKAKTAGALKAKAKANQGGTTPPANQGRIIGHTASLSDKASLKSASKQIDTVTPMVNIDQTMTDYVKGKNYTPRQDLALVVAAVRAMNPGTVRLPQKELELELAAGSWGDRFRRQYMIASEGLLPDDQRLDLQKVVHNETAHSAKNAAASWQQGNPNASIPVILQPYLQEQTGDTVVVQVDGKQYRMTRENMEKAIADGHKVVRIQ